MNGQEDKKGIHWKEEEKLDYSTQSIGFKTFATNPQDQSVSFRGNEGSAVHYKVGDTIGKSYRLLKQIGQGGMGVVYQASHLMFEQQYALKILAPNQITESSWSRFEIEGRSLAKINHQNIVKIYNMGIDEGGCPFYVMELLKGDALIDLMDKNLLEQRQILTIYSQACAGLSSAHRNGIVHRDVKPSNIMICANLREKDAVKIVDFGIASMQQGQQGQQLNTGQHNYKKSQTQAGAHGDQTHTEDYWLQGPGTQQQSITQAGEVFGSPFYMSPEQCSGERVDVRSDIYSLGCSLYHTLTGKPPFIGKTAMDTLMQHVTKPAPSLAEGNDQRQYAPALEQLVAKLMHKNPARRYQSMEQVMHDINRIAEGKAIAASGQTSGTFSDSSSLDIRDFSESMGADAAGETEDDEQEKDQHLLLTKFFKIGAVVSIIVIASTMAVMLYQPPAPPAVIKKVELENRIKENDAVNDETKKYAFTTAASHPVRTVERQGQKMRKIDFPTDISIGEIRLEGDKNSKQTAKNTVYVPVGKILHMSINRDIEVDPAYLAVLKNEKITHVNLQNIDKGIAEVFLQLSHFPYLRGMSVENITLSKDSLTALHSFSHLDFLGVKECEGEELDMADTTLLKNLKRVTFNGFNLKAELVEEVCAAPNIREMTVHECTYPKDFCARLANKPTLVRLEIVSDNLRDEDLYNLSKSKSIVGLQVKGRNFTRAAVESLASIKTLRRLAVLSPLKWDSEHVKRVEQKLPAGAVFESFPFDDLKNSVGGDFFSK